MPTVFVVQNHLRYNPDIGQLVPRYDISPAVDFGDFKFLLKPRETIAYPETVIKTMDEGLRNFSDDDHLLLIGNPVLIGWATSIAAAHNNGRVSLLVWSGRDKAYRAMKSVLPVTHRAL